MGFQIAAYEHVGIRVTDRDQARQFYEKLGWWEVIDLPEHHANEMVNEAGIYINLIFNGVKRKRNILQDEPLKYAGVTHVAFVVKDFDDLLKTLEHEDIPLSGGPHIYSDRRRVIFVRDPDRNVLEFNEVF
ncbi:MULTISPECIES: VOC family protein [unclassified Mameliella]|uniref:VOC family protein n=1 Tax=Mameliella sp. LZ-28 TaxID=2484146 RepID=UPI0032C0FF16